MELKLEATLLVDGVCKNFIFSTELRSVDTLAIKLVKLTEAMLEATGGTGSIQHSTVEYAIVKLPDTVKVEESKKVEEPKIETPKQGELPISEKKPLDKAMDEVDKKMAAADKKTTTKRTKNTLYDRTNDVHKARVSEFMDLDDREHPGRASWRTDGVLPKAVEASSKLNGKEFLDAEGKVLDTFKQAFIGLVRA